ncbi:YkgJ family cysteine cluster protein [Halovivax gelatinilyticus]|uniref:YkgJ family cysteine cluster protein n=1 Tax=Halovivax gelatinilyticus TaxID=2961597 RepID=UPI0020CA3842|nr:YkgJ family cysteine cluster protein [Halovivax gelatinilyticus]
MYTSDGDGSDGADADPPSGSTAESAPRVEVHPGREVVVDFDPGLTFECVDECSWCCHHGVLLYGKDLIELAARANLAETTTDFRGEKFVTREPKDRDEHVSEDGNACAFLGDDGLCRLHLEDDHDWKPTRCSVFPLAVSRDDGDLRVDVRESAHDHCEGLGVSDRHVIDHLDAFLPELLWELDDPDSDRVL